MMWLVWWTVLEFMEPVRVGLVFKLLMESPSRRTSIAAVNHKQRIVRQQVGKDRRVRGHDVLGPIEARPRPEQLGVELNAARVHAVLGLFEADEGGRFAGAAQGQKPEHAQRAL